MYEEKAKDFFRSMKPHEWHRLVRDPHIKNLNSYPSKCREYERTLHVHVSKILIFPRFNQTLVNPRILRHS